MSLPCGDLCYDQVADAVIEFEEAVAQESLELDAIDLPAAEAYTSFDDAFQDQRNLIQEQGDVLGTFTDRHTSLLDQLQSMQATMQFFSESRLAQAQVLLSDANELQAQINARIDAIAPTLNAIMSDVSRASSREVRAEDFRDAANAIVAASTSDLADIQTMHPQVNETLSTALSIHAEAQAADDCVQEGVASATDLHDSLRSQVSSLASHVSLAQQDRQEAQEEALLLQSRLDDMTSEVSMATSNANRLAGVSTDTTSESSRLSAATSANNAQEVVPLDGDLSSEMSTLSAAQDELGELSSQVSAALSTTASHTAQIQANTQLASTAVAQVTTLVAEASLLQAMCDNATDVVSQTAASVSAATSIVNANTERLSVASTTAATAASSLSAVSSKAVARGADLAELQAERMNAQSSLSSAIASSESIHARITDVQGVVSGNEMRVASVEMNAAARSSEVASATADAAATLTRAATDQAQWCALRDAVLGVRLDVGELSSAVAQYSQLASAATEQLSTLASALEVADGVVSANADALSTNTAALSDREASVVSLEDRLSAAASSIQCLPNVCFLDF
ncbi:hypothetical protein PTSG_05427 [Salpingoeca rosetta]|uniref:Uncharacterized protein n=1 Tax=Salpingoeca rosetta (strain ATCC 50818 / BSB-021) TaxID=946362 RepID=F2UAE6_SALR5|nr:uncharacterized protein PTSG_05427 [Salpingoeca rosetta]EGD73721.1 hypothetical protein PTSG_05427 [Salpingoeca rosetta]|eukprot:XP_004994002.1 hypothetical protein PTSG_05427 [Salpingoeca rosetta]